MAVKSYIWCHRVDGGYHDKQNCFERADGKGYQEATIHSDHPQS